MIGLPLEKFIDLDLDTIQRVLTWEMEKILTVVNDQFGLSELVGSNWEPMACEKNLWRSKTHLLFQKMKTRLFLYLAMRM